MKKALSGLLAIMMILSVMTACNRSSSDAIESSVPSDSSSESESVTETQPPEPTKGELLFKKNMEIEPVSFHRVNLDYSLDAKKEYNADGFSSVPLENSFICLKNLSEVKGEEYTSLGTYVMEYDYEGNRLDYYQIEEIGTEQNAYFLAEGDKILIIAHRSVYRDEGSETNYQVYEFHPQDHEVIHLFDYVFPDFSEMAFEALIDGKLYAWSGRLKDPTNCHYQRFDLTGKLECETETIDFSKDAYQYTEHYSYGQSSEYYAGSKYFCQGFWRENNFYVMKSADGDAAFDVLCFDKDLKLVDEFQTDIDSMKLVLRGEQRKDYITDRDGLYSWNEEDQEWENILSWDQLNIDYRSRNFTRNSQVLRNDRIIYINALLIPGEGLEEQSDSYTIVNIAKTDSIGVGAEYADENIQTRNKSYSAYYFDDYGKIHGCTKLEAMLDDFRNGDLDVMVVHDLFVEEGPIIGSKENMDLIIQLINEGSCLDLSPYVQPYLDGEQKAFFDTSVDLLTLLQSQGKLCAFPVAYPWFRVDTMYSNGNVLLESDATYSDWLEYAKTQGDGNMLLCYQKEAFLEKCLSYDLYSFIDAETGKAGFDCQEFKALLQLCKDYCDVPQVLGNGVDPFANAQVTSAKILSSTGMYSNVKKIGYPSANGTSYCLVPPVFVLISASSSHPDEAWTVVQNYVKKAESKYDHAVFGYSFSVSTGMVRGEGWAVDEKTRLSDVRLSYLPDRELMDVVISESRKYLFNDYTLDETVTDINKKAQEVLDNRKAG